VAPRNTPPFRADHVGSLLRPPELLAARAEHAAGRFTDEGLRAVEDDAVRAAIALQEEVGLLAVTDGELRRASWHMDFIYALGGIEPSQEMAVRSTFHNAGGTLEFAPPMAVVCAPITLERTIFADAFEFLSDAVSPQSTPKLTIPSPSMIHYRGGRSAVSPDTYPEMDVFWSDVAAVYAEEISRLADLGCTYLQIDDITLAYVNDPQQRAMLEARGESGESQHLTYIATLNEALRDRPDGMTVTTHTCRGNFRSSWVASGGYDFVAEALFNELDVDGFFMEFDDERSGGFEPLRFVPKGKTVVLGLVTTKHGELETKDEIKRRIEEAARFVDIDQLCLSPQCGFSSTSDGNSVTVDEQRAKLRLVVETAAEVWGD
jgi:5-methyltetrahydropteroyltriglutamate--homocysteine methyltransferase